LGCGKLRLAGCNSGNSTAELFGAFALVITDRADRTVVCLDQRTDRRRGQRGNNEQACGKPPGWLDRGRLARAHAPNLRLPGGCAGHTSMGCKHKPLVLRVIILPVGKAASRGRGVILQRWPPDEELAKEQGECLVKSTVSSSRGRHREASKKIACYPFPRHGSV